MIAASVPGPSARSTTRTRPVRLTATDSLASAPCWTSASAAATPVIKLPVARAPSPGARDDAAWRFLAMSSRTSEPSISSVAIHRMSPVSPAARVRVRWRCSASAAAVRAPAIRCSRTPACCAIRAWTAYSVARPPGPSAR
ncbi:MAG: hypothetical protein E6J90_28980 [Deltaproteobacteria bacterium]|nr:MAG: hypothetical protein E6J90_28980 [Deltaproteobacteria bacterium]